MKRLSVFVIFVFVSGCASVANKRLVTLERFESPPKSKPVKGPKPTKRAIKVRDPEKVIRKANEDAKRDPNLSRYINAAMVFEWEPNSLYQIYSSPLRITDVALEKGEVIKSITGGDTSRWQVVQTSSGGGLDEVSHIIIKPYEPNLNTNLVVMTDRRAYHLEIHSLKNGNYMASVRWKHPKAGNSSQSAFHMRSKTPAYLYFGYHFITKQKPSWMPVRVFDDGKKTYVQFPKSVKNREMPALFRLSSSKEAEIINFRTIDNTYIVDGLIEVAELRIGDDEKVGIERL